MTPREFKRLRKEAGFTVRELSALMAVHKSTIARWQSGRARIPEARARQVRQLHVEALKSQQKREGVMWTELMARRSRTAKAGSR
jgi:transcriptional regulator with XRE-family HTH domain